MPGAKQARRVPTEDEEQLVTRMSTAELRQRIDCVRASAAFDLRVRHLKTRLAFDCELGHREPVLRLSQSRPPVWRLRARDEQDAIEARPLHPRFCHSQVTYVDRGECPAQDAQPQG